MKLVRKSLDFNREGEPKQKIGIGHKRFGQPKSFEEVEKGDTAIDYSDFKSIILDKIVLTFGPDGRPTEKGQDFVDSYDTAGVAEDIWSMGNYDEGDTMEMIATEDDEGDSLVWDYGPDGAVAIW